MVTLFGFCRVLIDNISDDMASEDLDNMKFLLSKTLSREQMEKSKVKPKLKFLILVCWHPPPTHMRSG